MFSTPHNIIINYVAVHIIVCTMHVYHSMRALYQLSNYCFIHVVV